MRAALFWTLTLASMAAFAADLSDLDGEWIYYEDVTPGRNLPQMSPPMSSRFVIKTEADAVILVSGHGNGHSNVRLPLDGTPTELPGSEGATVRYQAEWKDGSLITTTGTIRPNVQPSTPIRREFTPTKAGLRVRVSFDTYNAIGIYRHPEDIPLAIPTPATIGDLNWLVGNWAGTRGSSGTTTIEERWSPARGGTMLAVSRTVSRDSMSAFEYLRIVERDGSLVYIAQPNGGTATEFILTVLTPTKAVFDNSRHSYPKRITYQLAEDGSLSATIGFLVGGTPTRFEFKREEQ